MSFPTSYIPTSGSQVTRAPDVAEITGPDFDAFHNSTEGTVLVDSVAATGTSSSTDLTDVKLFGLADTDDTDLVGSGELVTNGTFDTDLSGWSGSGFVQSNGEATSSTDDSIIDQLITTESGKTYVVTFDITENYPDFQNGLYIRESDISSYIDFRVTDGSTGSFSGTFIANGSSMGVRLYRGGGGAGNITFDNISVKLADADRSVNNNGLIINGNVTREPVAPGADLVGYGVGDDGVMELPDHNFSSVSSFIFWAKNNNLGDSTVFYFDDPNTSNRTQATFRLDSEGLQVQGDGISLTSSNTLGFNNNWAFYSLIFDGTNFSLYENGEIVGTDTLTNVISGNSDVIIGDNRDGPTRRCQLALFRISATAPTAEQIRRIYEAERDFFTENASYTIPSVNDYTLDVPQKFIQFDDSAIANRITAERDASGNLQIIGTKDGGEQTYTQIGPLANGDTAKFAFAYDNKGISTCLNGGTVTTDTTFSVPQTSTLRIGSGIAGLEASTYIKSIKYYPRRLTNNQIKEITS